MTRMRHLTGMYIKITKPKFLAFKNTMIEGWQYRLVGKSIYCQTQSYGNYLQ